MSTFDLGDVAILKATVLDPETGEPLDPDEVEAVIITVRKPDGQVEGLTTNSSEGESGVYRASVVLDQENKWWWSVDVTGDAEGASESHFNVRPRRVPRTP